MQDRPADQPRTRSAFLKTTARAVVGLAAFASAAKLLGGSLPAAEASTNDYCQQTYFVFDHVDCNGWGQSPYNCNPMGLETGYQVDWYKTYDQQRGYWCGWQWSGCCFDDVKCFGDRSGNVPWSNHPNQTC